MGEDRDVNGTSFSLDAARQHLIVRAPSAEPKTAPVVVPASMRKRESEKPCAACSPSETTVC